MRERRDLIREGINELGRGMFLLCDAEERGIASSDASAQLNGSADAVELVTFQLEAGFPTANQDPLPSLLRKGRAIFRKAAHDLSSADEVTREQLTEPSVATLVNTQSSSINRMEALSVSRSPPKGASRNWIPFRQ